MQLRRGFTLVELVAALAVAGVAATFIIRTLLAQQRFYTSASAVLGARAQIRDAADVLATDIRNASVDSPSFVLMSDSAVEMFTTIAASVVCTTPSPAAVGLPPLALSSGMTITSLLALPDTGDLAVIYTYPPGRPDSGRWEHLKISSFTTVSMTTACPASTGFTGASDVAESGYRATLAQLPSNPIVPGNPIRFLRRGRYSLYRSSDSRWYLGYRRCNSSGCGAVQPASGPYDPYGSQSSGLEFRYYDPSGAQLGQGSNPSRLSRVDIVIRGKSSRRSSLAGDTRAAYADSSVITVSPRNRVH